MARIWGEILSLIIALSRSRSLRLCTAICCIKWSFLKVCFSLSLYISIGRVYNGRASRAAFCFNFFFILHYPRSIQLGTHRPLVHPSSLNKLSYQLCARQIVDCKWSWLCRLCHLCWLCVFLGSSYFSFRQSFWGLWRRGNF